MRKSICLLIALAVITTFFAACSDRKQQEEINKTGIILKETILYEEASLKTKYIDVHKNDLVYVISKAAKGYYVQMPWQQVPATEGYIPLEAVSFNESLFSCANYGVIENATLYNTPDINDVYDTWPFATVTIRERQGGSWVLCSLPAGAGERWIQADKIIYRVQRATYEEQSPNNWVIDPALTENWDTSNKTKYIDIHKSKLVTSSNMIDPQREIVENTTCYWDIVLNGDVELRGGDKTLREFILDYLNFDIVPYYGKQITIITFDAVPQTNYMSGGQTQESARLTYLFAFANDEPILNQGLGLWNEEVETVKNVCFQLENYK